MRACVRCDDGCIDKQLIILVGMSSEESFDNNSINDEYDQQQTFRNRYKKQAGQCLNALDYRNVQSRKLLATYYRKLNQQLNKVELDRFNLNDTDDMISEISKSAYFFQPYRVQDFQFKFYSSICKEATRGGRKCKEPLIKIDHAVVHFQGKNQKIIIKDKPFLLSIQSEPNSTIIYTNKPRTHPLLIFTEQQCGAYFRKRMNEKCSEMLTPPCDLSIIVIKQPFKVESKLVYLKIISNQSEQIKNRMYEMGWAIRPEQSFNYEDSASGNAISYSMNEQSY